MSKKRYRPEEIISNLRQVDIFVGLGETVALSIKKIGVNEVTYYRWRQEYGGMSTSQEKRLKELEKENSRLHQAVSDLTLGRLILQEAAKGSF